jgi:hypothetical protein
MSKSVLVYLILSSFLLAKALTCRCMAVSVEDNLKQSDAVFFGKVVRVTPHRNDVDIVVKFDVNDVWKGDRINTVRTSKDDRMCGVGFKQGREYIVFASKVEGGYYTSICDRTQELDDDIFTELNEVAGR